MNYRIKLIRWLIHLNERIFFYPKLRDAYKKLTLPNNPIIFDIGGNKGQSIDFYTYLFPDSIIYSFEPNQKLYQFLLRKYNGLARIQIFNLGVSNTNGFLTFHESILDETSTFETVNMESSYVKKKARILGTKNTGLFKNSYQVKVVKLSDFLVTMGINRINVLKIDVEGHELAVLQGLFNDNGIVNINFIQIENHQDDQYKNINSYKQLMELLNNKGFKLISKIRHGFGNFYEEIFYNTR